MKDKNVDLLKLLSRLAKEEYCYMTTKGRKTGRLHEIEIWFGIQGNTLYLLSGGGEDSDWVKNLRADPNVTVRIAKHTFMGIAHVVNSKEVEALARPILAAKYQRWREGRRMSEWARTALVVGIDFISLG